MNNDTSLYSIISKRGDRIHVRPLEIADAPYLVDLFENMSPESRYRRFLQAVTTPDIDTVWTEAERIAQGTSGENRGLIAFCDRDDRPDVPVAAARYMQMSPKQAEVAVSVRDDMQGMGIGSQLVGLLIAEAKERGLERLAGTVQNDNLAMLHILRKSGYRLSVQPEGIYTSVLVYLDQPLDWPDAAADYSPEAQFDW